MVKALGVFALLFVLDFVWAAYTRATVDRRPVAASHLALLIYLLGGLATLGWMNDPWLLAPACAGAWLGTYASVRYLTIKGEGK